MHLGFHSSSQKATDALLNFETVKYFCAETHEQQRYEVALQEYRVAQIDAQKAMSVLNLGQNFVITFGVVLAMWVAAAKVLSQNMGVSDFVLVNQFILTVRGVCVLCAPRLFARLVCTRSVSTHHRVLQFVSTWCPLFALSLPPSLPALHAHLVARVVVPHCAAAADRRRVHVQNLCRGN